MTVLRFRVDPDELVVERPAYMVTAIAELQRILKAAGYIAPDWLVVQAWQAFSESMCAGWMVLYDRDEDNLSEIMNYLEPDPNASRARREER